MGLPGGLLNSLDAVGGSGFPEPRESRNPGLWDWKAFLGIAISAVLIWWVLRGVDPGEVWGELRRARWGYLVAAVAVATSGFVIRALRWRIFLKPVHAGTPFRSRFAAVNIGFAANNLLPARVGEFARAWAIARMERVPMSGALGSLVVERFLDGVAIFSLLLVALLHPSFPSDATVAGRPVGAAMTVVVSAMFLVLVALLFLLFRPGLPIRWARWIAPRLPGEAGKHLVQFLESFLAGLGALRDPGLLLPGLAWSLGLWGWNAVSFWLAFMAFGIDVGYFSALFVQGIIALGVAVPAAPGFFGTFHAAAVVGLHEVYGVGEGATLAFAFGYHLGGFIPVTLMGLWYAEALGFRMGDLRRADEAVEDELDREGVG